MPTPLATLAEYFMHHRSTDESLILGSGAQKSIVAYQKSHPAYEAVEVEAVVSALDVEGSALCQRLNGFGAVILCSIFLHSKPCLAQQRGLYLLAASIRKTESETSYDASGKARKKSEMSAALPPLIKDFVNSETSDASRRWMGVLALELLTGCPANAGVLRNETHKRWRHISEIVMLSNRRVLRHLAGSIMRQLVFYGTPLDQFLEVEDNETLFSRFPNSQHHDSQWIISFENFIEELPTNNGFSHEEESSRFACGILFGETLYQIGEEAAILVTIGLDVSVIVPSSARRPAVYIDIPIRNIRAVGADQRQNTQSQTPTYALQLDLLPNQRTLFYVNAKPDAEACIFLAFKSQSAASDVKSAIESRFVADRGDMLFNHSETEAIDVSKLPSGNKVDSLEYLLSSPAPEGEDHPLRGDSATEIPEAITEARRIPAQRQRPISLVQEMIERATTEDDASNNLPSMAIAAIDVSIHRETEPNPGGADVVGEEASDAGLTSSLQWQKGLSIIDLAPEFQDIPDKSGQGCSETIDVRHETREMGEDRHTSVAIPQVKSTTLHSRQPSPTRQADLDTPVADSSVLSAGLPSRKHRELHNCQANSKVSQPVAKASLAGAALGQVSKKTSMPPPKRTILAKNYVKSYAKSSGLPSDERKSATVQKGKSTGDPIDGFNDGSLTQLARPEDASKTAHVQSATSASQKGVKLSSHSQPREVKNNAESASALPSQRVSPATAATDGKASSTHHSTKKITPKLRNKFTEKEPDIWEEGLSFRTEEAEDASVLYNRGNQSKKLLAPGAKAQTSTKKKSKSMNINSSDRTTKSIPSSKASMHPSTSDNVAPVADTQPRPKRAAAVKANERIEHQLDSEEAADELIVDKVTPMKRLVNPKAKSQSTAEKPMSASIKRIGAISISNSKDIKSSLPIASEASNAVDSNHPAIIEDLASSDKVDHLPSRIVVTQSETKHLQVQSGKGSNGTSSRQQGDDDVVSYEEYNRSALQLADEDISFAPERSSDSVESLVNSKDNNEPVVVEEKGPIMRAALPKVKQGVNLNGVSQNSRDKHRHSKEQQQAVGTDVKGDVTFQVKTTKAFKDPFAAKLNNAASKQSDAIAQSSTCIPKLDIHKSNPGEQILTRTPVKGTSLAATLGSRNEDRPVEQNLSAVILGESAVKRKAAKLEKGSAKRTKALPPIEYSTGSIKNSSIQNAVTTPIASIDRKADVICFDRSEPKNRDTIPWRPVVACTGSPTAPPKEQLRIDLGAKVPTVDDQGRVSKHINSRNTAPSPFSSLTNELPPADVLPSHVISSKRPPRVSSNTRVTAAGSPIIVSQNEAEGVAEESVSTDNEAVEDALIAAKLDEDGDMQMRNEADKDAVLPKFERPLGTHVEQVSVQGPSRNRKHQPSSPLAASAFADLGMHQIRDDGTIMNIAARKPVVPTLPHNPFEASGSKRNSSFMEALRKSNAVEHSAQRRETATQARLRRSLAALEDPDKTLVEHPRTERHDKCKEVLVTSPSSSGSSSRDGISEQSEKFTDGSQSQQRQVYEPHQESIYLVLSNIMNRLVQRQIEREKGLQDMVDDYTRGGKLLVQRFIDECHESLEANKEDNTRVATDMAALYKGSIENLSKLSKQVLKNRTMDVEAEWSERQQKLLDAANAALAACEM